MQVSPELYEENRKEILANYRTKPYVVGPLHYQERVRELLKFVNTHRKDGSKILDVGSGGFMPVVLGATHALDIHPVAGELLQREGFSGKFVNGVCYDLPFPQGEFDIAVCTEVIEHLPDLSLVKKTFQELERVARRWVVTTPRASASGVRDKWNIEPTHKQFLTSEDVYGIVSKIDTHGELNIRNVDHYVFIEKS